MVGATVNVGTNITLLPGVIFSADGLSAADGIEYSTNVTAPNNVPVPLAVVRTMDSVGSCDGVVLDGSSSSGSAGRALNYKWTAVSDPYLTQLRADDFQPLVDAVDLINASRLDISSAQLYSGRSYRFELTVTNWLGRVLSFSFLSSLFLSYPLSFSSPLLSSPLLSTHLICTPVSPSSSHKPPPSGALKLVVWTVRK